MIIILIFQNNNILIAKTKIDNILIKYNDYEINTLLYETALKDDKRTFCQYYNSLLKRRHMLIFIFFTNDDYNSKIIKISLFLFSFSLDYAVNALFFVDSSMHKILVNEGNFDFNYELPKIIYSFIISKCIYTLIEYLSLSEKNVLEIKNRLKNKRENAFKILKCLNIKFVLYFILNFTLLIFFWYYLSCFCAVYKNTQIHLISDTLISFATSLLSTLGLCLLPGIFRIRSLKFKNKETLYNFSKFLQFI